MSKAVLVTGGAGFVGHHMVKHLLTRTNMNVVVLDRLDISGTLHRIAEVLESGDYEGRVKFVWHDLKSPINWHVGREIGHVDYVVHMAASSHVDRSIERPVDFVMDNVVGTAHLFDYLRSLSWPKPRKIVYFSTDEVFGPAAPGIQHQEWHHYCSGNPYAASKAGAEELALAFHNTYGLPIIITHTMNVFGIRQHPEKFIPSTIRKITDGETVLIHADSECKVSGSRFYTYADDVARAVSDLLEVGLSGDKYNIVGAKEIPNLDLAIAIGEILGIEAKCRLVDFHSSRPGHDLRYALDGSKLAELGFEPSTSFREQLENVVIWTIDNKRWLGL